MEKQITVLTPTYNRAEYLKKLYESLLKQTEQLFIWMIADDGSDDETAEIVRTFQNEKKIEIRYFYQPNGGKHRALNSGIRQIQTELTYIVDSDDYLPDNAIEIILKYHLKYRKVFNIWTGEDTRGNRICGYCFLRYYSDGRVNTAKFAEKESIGNYVDVRINENNGGDKAEVFFTAILKKFPFPEYQGEKFVPEDLVWMQMAGKYDFVHINEKVYICDYMEGGLTRTGHRNKIHSPHGMMKRSEVYLRNQKVKKSVRIKMMLLYQIYGHFAGEHIFSAPDWINDKVEWSLLYIPSLLVYCRWKREAKNEV
ncbi:MAG: glycosyltransferase family 2 protein [Butyrivibrio sp.]|nr:glycosyltransferase family 2 protein [Butyrivibrio sp.]